MNIEKELLDNQQVKLTVEVDEDQLEAAKRKAAKKIARRIKIPGFRPGKAPYQVIRRQIGDEALFEESLEIVVKDLYPQVVDDAEIEPYGPGNLENVVSFDPLILEFVVPLMAEVELGDYQSIRFPYEPPEVTDEEIDAVQQDFRQRQAVEETVDRPAAVGDQVYLRLSARRFEGDQDEGEETSADLIDERSTSMIIAGEQDDTSNEWPFDGFSRELTGMSAGEDKTLIYTFPEDSPYESLRGISAEFSIHMEDVKERVMPELDDEFAKSLGEYDDLTALQQDIRESLEDRALETYHSEYDDQVLDAIITDSVLKYPPQMLEQEQDSVIQQLENRLRNQGLDMDIYLKTRDMEYDDLRAEAEPVAQTRVERSLVLLEIARQEEIDVEEQELEQETSRTLESITQYMSDTDKKKFQSPNALMNLTGSIYAEMRMDKTIQFLRKVASGEAETEEETAPEEPLETTDEGTPEEPGQITDSPPEDEGTQLDEGVQEETSVEAIDSSETSESDTDSDQSEAKSTDSESSSS